MKIARIVFLLSAGSVPVHAQLAQVDTTISLADALAHAASGIARAQLEALAGRSF